MHFGSNPKNEFCYTKDRISSCTEILNYLNISINSPFQDEQKTFFSPDVKIGSIRLAINI
jgi:hypothetical protein